MAKRKIEEITKEFGAWHTAASDAKRRMEKLRKEFFDQIDFGPEELARQSIWYEGTDPELFVAVYYPRWHIKKLEQLDPDILEWKIVLEEDPKWKQFAFINRADGQVYQRGVAESSPEIDLERVKVEDPQLYEEITFVPERQLCAELTLEQQQALISYLRPPKLSHRMEKPRKAKPEEIE